MRQKKEKEKIELSWRQKILSEFKDDYSRKVVAVWLEFINDKISWSFEDLEKRINELRVKIMQRLIGEEVEVQLELDKKTTLCVYTIMFYDHSRKTKRSLTLGVGSNKEIKAEDNLIKK